MMTDRTDPSDPQGPATGDADEGSEPREGIPVAPVVDVAEEDAASDADSRGVLSPRTQEIVHRLAVGLAAVAGQTAELHQRLTQRLEPVGPAKTEATKHVRAGLDSARDTAHRMTDAAREAGDRAEEAVAAAKARAVGLALRVEEVAEGSTNRVQETAQELAARARAAREAGVDFYARHREEILALVVTAVKVAAVIGVRRLARRVETEDRSTDANGADHRGARAAHRVREASGLVLAVVGELGQLLSKQPSALPMLRELYRRGEPAEQAVVGMLLGPALAADPKHAVQVIREFLEDASDDATVDVIARRSLAPLLQENPELVDQVTPWLRAAGPLVRRGALVGLGRLVSNKGSRIGDVVAASVVVLEDHDEEVRQALRWLLSNASRGDLDATARAVVEWRRTHGTAGDPTLDDMPEALRERIESMEDVDDTKPDEEA